MGLDTSHNAWHGGYMTFSKWREALAEAAGYAIANVVYDDGRKSTKVLIDWGHIAEWTDPNYHGSWTREPDDALLYLIVHSDCDGELSPERFARLADRLEELLPLLEPFEDMAGMPDFYAQKTRQFIEGAREAAAANEPIKFY